MAVTEQLGPAITTQSVKKFARTACRGMWIAGRRDYLRALAQRVEVDVKKAGHHGHAKRTAAHARRHFKHNNGGF
jgi:hypothetical protein